MRSDDFFYLGKVTKVVGLKGELSVYLDTDEPEKYYSMESVFLEQQEELVPFFVTSLKVKNRQQVVVQFQDVDAGYAPSLVGAELFLPLSMLPPLTGNRFYYHEIKGFEIVDEEQRRVGVCKDVLEYPHQALFQIDHDGTEVLIPIVDDLIRHVDRASRRIVVSMPEGLLDIYLNPSLE
ncbi:MAG: 16S rRNA processing protein RimM [Bacteroidales bacterium]|jgi:16S rRNA processing protein RimM|nr:16S rRNA processing protein RimM [Bacteroidales bacterium]MBR4512664.1 16S rRNA processing protein RimM [Bacteroidales bacterium]MBR6919727.1 16S rRNA processing protein RimM [Bacteroidales bacterium]